MTVFNPSGVRVRQISHLLLLLPEPDSAMYNSVSHPAPFTFTMALVIYSFTVAVAQPQAERFPYLLNKKDLFYGISATALYGYALGISFLNNDSHDPAYRPHDQSGIPAFDRSATRRWNPRLDRAGDYVLPAFCFIPAAFSVRDLQQRHWNNIITLAAMYSETVLTSLALSEIAKSLTGRIRPCMYNRTLSDKTISSLAEDSDTYRSFFSRHTTLAFSTALFCSRVTKDLYRHPALTTAVTVSSLTVASAIGLSRYASGRHFPSDILAGMIIGGIIGYGIPLLHLNNGNGAVIRTDGRSVLVCLTI